MQYSGCNVAQSQLPGTVNLKSGIPSRGSELHGFSNAVDSFSFSSRLCKTTLSMPRVRRGLGWIAEPIPHYSLIRTYSAVAGPKVKWFIPAQVQRLNNRLLCVGERIYD